MQAYFGIAVIVLAAALGCAIAGEDEYPPLPIPADMYRGQCPFQKWYSKTASHFGLWESTLIGKYLKAWQEAGSPRGIRKDDHDYDTVLGQGNTLGFHAARLEISDVPEGLRYGLFANASVLPAVVRFSDFGADNSTVKLARMAVKLPFASAWGGEVNLLFTETMDSFPLADYDMLAAFADDDQSPWYKNLWDKVQLLGGVLLVGINDGLKVYEAMKDEPLAKKYFSQLPYMLGEHQAMKFQLIPHQKTCADDGETSCCLPATEMPTAADAPKWATTRAGVAASYFSGCDAVFELQIQVKNFDNADDNETILHSGDAKWPETPITVGFLTIPKHNATSDWSVDTKLQDALQSELKVDPTGVDKMFAFHPILTHYDNRPVGDVNAFRAAFYSQNAQSRYNTIHKDVFYNLSTSTGLPESLKTVLTMPFEALQQRGVFGELQGMPVLL